ncbi:MAG: HlyD family efflux transporter periplasmic adaptor subunit [Mariprofundus sp.]|nr:HlyD family efflux transporter periplasmic adaptor subunit [Mariprofundus sp.]
MRLRHPKPVLSHSQTADTAKPSLGSRVTRWLYFSVLFGLIGYIIWYGVFRFFYVDNRGLVEADRTRVASVRGGRILELPVQNGDQVKKGDLLVRLKSPADCATAIVSEDLAETPELRTLRRKQLSDRSRLNMLVRQRKAMKTRLGRMRYRHAMELSLSSSASQRQNLEDGLLRTSGEIRSLRAIIPVRKKDIQHLEEILKRKVIRPACLDELIHAPYDGKIVSKDHWRFEVMQRTEPIMDIIANDANVHIESYFSNDTFKTLSVGMELTVFFPDGSESKAKITDIKSTSLQFPARDFQDNYLPFRTRILATLEPVDDVAEAQWKQFNQMEVEVRGWR